MLALLINLKLRKRGMEKLLQFLKNATLKLFRTVVIFYCFLI